MLLYFWTLSAHFHPRDLHNLTGGPTKGQRECPFVPSCTPHNTAYLCGWWPHGDNILPIEHNWLWANKCKLTHKVASWPSMTIFLLWGGNPLQQRKLSNFSQFAHLALNHGLIGICRKADGILRGKIYAGIASTAVKFIVNCTLISKN